MNIKGAFISIKLANGLTKGIATTHIATVVKNDKHCIDPTYSSSFPGKSSFARPMLYVKFKEQKIINKLYQEVNVVANP